MKLPPHYIFFGALGLNEEERYLEGLNLKNLFYDSKREWKERVSFLYSNDGTKVKLVNECIEHANVVLFKLDYKKNNERELLQRFIDYLYDSVPELNRIAPPFKQEKIFKTEKVFQLYLDTLRELNVIDEEYNIKYGFQAGANAIFRSTLFKKNFFVFNLQLKEYIIFLNQVFNAKIKSKSKLSDGVKYEDQVEKYFQEVFVKS